MEPEGESKVVLIIITGGAVQMSVPLDTALLLPVKWHFTRITLPLAMCIPLITYKYCKAKAVLFEIVQLVKWTVAAPI